jgi:hypothetical protein
MFLDFLANPVTRAALPGLLAIYHQDEETYERLVLRSEADVRGLMTGLLRSALSDLAASDVTARSDTVFDFLVAITVARAMTRGLTDREAFTDRTADALTTLALAPIAVR